MTCLRNAEKKVLLLRNVKDGGFLTNVKRLRLETDQISV